jgi:hypothetical protein
MWKNIAAIHSILKKKLQSKNFNKSIFLKSKINKNNFGKKRKKTEKKEKKGKVSKKKKKRKALWITVVIHSAFGCERTVISAHPLVICIMYI